MRYHLLKSQRSGILLPLRVLQVRVCKVREQEAKSDDFAGVNQTRRGALMEEAPKKVQDEHTRDK